MLQFKELCDNNYMLCEDEYHLYDEWTQVMEGGPRYVSIMSLNNVWSDYRQRQRRVSMEQG